METIKVNEFNKNIKGKGFFQELAVYPYFSNENKIYGRVVILSDKVKEVTMVGSRNKKVAMVIPYHKDIRTSISNHIEVVLAFIRVMAPVISIYDLHNKKLAQLDVKVA